MRFDSTTSHRRSHILWLLSVCSVDCVRCLCCGVRARCSSEIVVSSIAALVQGLRGLAKTACLDLVSRSICDRKSTCTAPRGSQRTLAATNQRPTSTFISQPACFRPPMTVSSWDTVCTPVMCVKSHLKWPWHPDNLTTRYTVT